MDNLKLAYKRLQTAPGNWYKNFYRQEIYCFNIALEKYLEALSQELINKIYTPKPAYKVYVPKGDGFLRPISIISLDDMVIYQAIINIVAKVFYEELRPNYNTIVFGNHYNGDSDERAKIYFFAKWQKQWKKFRMTTERYWERGFKYLVSFDLALFYETIDHTLLGNAIFKDNKLDSEVIEILLCQLKEWIIDEERENKFKYLHGIPQGPIGSAFLAEVYLLYIDTQMRTLMNKEKDFVYLRYADDIRILAKSHIIAKKTLIQLSMFCRDLGLVPNIYKTNISYYENKWELDQQSKLLSKIGEEYYRERTLSRKQNQTLTKKVVYALKDEETEMQKQCSCAAENDLAPNKLLDKTLLKFALYRIEPNEEVRDLLLANHDRLHFLSDEVCQYLLRCFPKDESVLKWAEKLIVQERPIYEYSKAMLLKHFRGHLSLPEYCLDILTNDSVHWLVKFYAIPWISDSKDMVSILSENKNPFINRQILFLKYDFLSDNFAKKIHLRKMLKSDDRSVALMGVYLVFQNSEYIDILDNEENLSSFLNSALHDLHTNMLAKDLKKESKLENSDKFFSKSFWSEEELKLLNQFYFSAKHNWEPYPYSWIVSIDSINHLIINKVFKLESYNFIDRTEYGSMLEFGQFKRDYPETYYIFNEIHDSRNGKGAHPLDKVAQPAKLLTQYEQQKLWQKEIKALREIIDKHI